eukprot:2472497-Prymnesium_polylepis.1
MAAARAAAAATAAAAALRRPEAASVPRAVGVGRWFIVEGGERLVERGVQRCARTGRTAAARAHVVGTDGGAEGAHVTRASWAREVEGSDGRVRGGQGIRRRELSRRRACRCCLRGPGLPSVSTGGA